MARAAAVRDIPSVVYNTALGRYCKHLGYNYYPVPRWQPYVNLYLPYTLAHEHYNVTFEPCAEVRTGGIRPGRFSSRDARHERHLYALRSDGAAIDVTPLASAAPVEHSSTRNLRDRDGNLLVTSLGRASRDENLPGLLQGG